MASSSDTANAVRGFVPPQNDDERRLMRRVEELCRVAVRRGIPHIIDALDQGQSVHVTGRGYNHTDIRVQLHPLLGRL